MSSDSRSHSPSPTVASSKDGVSLIAVTAPSSPVLSTQSSVHIASPSLRDNKPEELNSYSSLNLLSTLKDRVSIQASNTTFGNSHERCSSLDETEPGLGSGDFNMVLLHHVRPPNNTASPTHTHLRSYAAKSDTGCKQNDCISKVGLVQDESVNPHPFKFTPAKLTSLFATKNLKALEDLGGIEGLLEGLGTHPSRGLMLLDHDGDRSSNVDRYLASIIERQRVFGVNVLPQPPSKSLLALISLALKDKLLVRIF